MGKINIASAVRLILCRMHSSRDCFYLNFTFLGQGSFVEWAICLTLKVGATGIEPMTSTVSR
jgi:hypothetical protein